MRPRSLHGTTSISIVRSTCSGAAVRSNSRSASFSDEAFRPTGRILCRVTLLASIPSPHSGTVDVGPLTIHMYGLMLLLAIAACIALTGYRWVRWGGDWDLVFRVAVWGVGFGIV